MKRKILAFIMSAALAAGSTGCSYMTGSGEYPVKIAGYTFNEQPDSIVCLDDSVADILISCGFSELITARSDECTQEEIADVGTVGSESNPDAQKIIAVQPDVVFADKNLSDDVRKKLVEENINIITMVQAKNNQDLSVLYESLGAVAGGEQSGRKIGMDKAESVIMTMSDLQRIIPESDMLMTVCYLYDTDGNVAYDDTFAGKLFSYANAVNVCGNDDGDVIQKITLSNPQYIFCATGVKEKLQNDENFKNLNAVKNDKVYEIDKNLFERQGNSITQVLSFMIETMYPELVEDSDNSQKTSQEEQSIEESVEESSEESSEESIEESSEESSEQSVEESSEESSEQSVEESSEESSEESVEESSEESAEQSVEESSEESSEQSEEQSSRETSKVQADDSLNITAGMRYSLGERDDNIAIIQQRLKDLGYFNDEPTGYYGQLTAQAVSDYEETNRIAPDGNLSTPELYLLFSDEVLPANS